MINNRQQSGRRRGRGQGGQGGPRQGGGGRGPESGNRVDNRARGNAPQLHEKYKTLARDAQQSGDRVLMEYYLQFADHYFRVMSESRARYEENQAQRQQRDFGGEDMGYEGEEGDESDITDDFDQRMPGQQQQPQPRYNRDRNEGRPEGRQDARQDRPEQPRQYRDRDDNRPRRDYEERRPNGNGYDGNRAERPAPRDDRAPERSERDDTAEPATLSLDVLPPSFAVDMPAAASEDAPAPRRRGRPRKDAAAAAPPADA